MLGRVNGRGLQNVLHKIAQGRLVLDHYIAIDVCLRPAGKRENLLPWRYTPFDRDLQGIVAKVALDVRAFGLPPQRSFHRHRGHAPRPRVTIGVENAWPGDHRVEHGDGGQDTW